MGSSTIARVQQGRERTSTLTRSYDFGADIPGKPRKYLLNAGGRPKLFKELARVRASDYAAFRLA